MLLVIRLTAILQHKVQYILLDVVGVVVDLVVVVVFVVIVVVVVFVVAILLLLLLLIIIIIIIIIIKPSYGLLSTPHLGGWAIPE